MLVDSLLNGIGGFRLLAVHHDAVSLEQHILHQVLHILFALNDLFSQSLARQSTELMQVCIPQFELRLLFEPPIADQQAVHHTRSIVFVHAGNLASGLGCLENGSGEDIAVRLRDALFREFAWDDLFNLVLQAQGDEGDLSRGDGAGDAVFAVVGGEERLDLIVKTASVALVPREELAPIDHLGHGLEVWNASLSRWVAWREARDLPSMIDRNFRWTRRWIQKCDSELAKSRVCSFH